MGAPRGRSRVREQRAGSNGSRECSEWEGDRMARRGVRSWKAAAAVALAVLALAAPARAADTMWTCGTGDWTDDCWTAGAPISGDNPILNVNSAVDIDVTFNDSIFFLDVTASFGNLTVNNPGAGDMILIHVGAGASLDLFRATNEAIGTTGSGIMRQSGNSTRNITTSLDLGTTSTGSGTYILESGGVTAEFERIGQWGTGTFEHTGGGNTITSDLILGDETGSLGQYDLSESGASLGSSVIANGEIIGNAGTGIFNQTDGTNTVAGDLNLGLASTGHGTYELSGTGALEANKIRVGSSGTGVFTHSAGTNTVVDLLNLGNLSSGHGTYDLSGTGALTADREFIGNGGIGIFNQTGGSNIVAGGLDLGQTLAGNGTYNLSAGSVQAGSQGIGNFGTGLFAHSGGTNTVDLIIVGNVGGSNGQYDLSGTGALAVDRLFVGNNGVGVFNQTSGTNTVAGTQGILRVGGGSTGDGTYNLSGGTLSSTDAIIGISGTGLFNQTGGTYSVSTAMTLAANPGSSGTYDLSGTGALEANKIRVGSSGTGVFTHSAGTNTVVDLLNLGNLSSGHGTYDLSGTGALTADREFIGNGGIGIFNQTGGSNIVAGGLDLGQTLAGNGTYNLSAGSVQAGSQGIGNFGTGLFAHSGGTNTVDLIIVGNVGGSNGQYDLSGTGALAVDRLFVGNNGVGVFNQTSGTNTVAGTQGILRVGGGSTGDGTYNLSGGTLSSTDAIIGISGTGLFNQTGGTYSVSTAMTLAANPGSSGTYDLSGTGALSADTIQVNAGGNFMQSGGTLTVSSATMNIAFGGSYSQSGGTVNGTVDNAGTYTYSAGTFTGRLVNNGVADFQADFTAGDGMQHFTDLNVGLGRTLTLNGFGLENNGTMTLAGGTLAGNGPQTNMGLISGFGTLGGSGGLSNFALISQSGGALSLANAGANTNSGTMNLLAGNQFRLLGGDLTNMAGINLNGGIVTGTAALINAGGGTIAGPGTILAALNNSGGTLSVNGGTTSVLGTFSNAGVVQLSGAGANLAGATLNNTGTVQGYGQVGNQLVNAGIVEALGGTLTLGGAGISNTATGQMLATTGNKILATQGLASNDGAINLTGGTFDNNNNAMANSGQIAGFGTLRTGGLTNSNTGTIIFGGGPANILGTVTNNNFMQTQGAATTFFAPVTNSATGTIKNTSGTFNFLGGLTNAGAFVSDPADNFFTDLEVMDTGYLVGGVGDRFFVSNDFINQSLQNTQWSTGLADLIFESGIDGAHDVALAGLDLGDDFAGFTDNFAWGTLDIMAGQTLALSDGNLTAGGALYVDTILIQDALLAAGGIDDLLSLNPGELTTIFGNGFSIYYNPFSAGNDYLGGRTFALTGGGYLAPLMNGSGMTPVPEPGTLAIFVFGLVGLGFAARRRGRALAA